MVECEFPFRTCQHRYRKVLIDTWWNVNEDYLDVLGNIESVLIDTWWNVNKSVLVTYTPGEQGFNRYMVECEFVQSYVNLPQSLRF